MIRTKNYVDILAEGQDIGKRCSGFFYYFNSVGVVDSFTIVSTGDYNGQVKFSSTDTPKDFIGNMVYETNSHHNVKSIILTTPITAQLILHFV